MRERLQRFMAGRYGNDRLNQVLSIVALALIVVSLFTGLALLNSLALAVLVYTLFRSFSRNVHRRQAEGAAFERLWGRVTRFFKGIPARLQGSKTHRYYRCPQCKQQLRVPKGRGRIQISCPKCHHSFEKNT